jgi:putative PEP-CTERM system TPR-repeat lipoprotein
MATELNGGSAPDITANYGLSLIGSGQVEQGVAQLQKAYSKDPGGAQSGVPLALMYMKQGQTKPAVQLLQTITKKEPDNLTALNVLGIARGLSGDRAGARKVYTQVLARDGHFVPAILNLARLDLYEGKPDDARARLMAILKDQPRNLDAHFELAQVELNSQRPQDAIRWLEKARSFNPQSLRPNLMLVDLYLSLGDVQKALDAAKDAQSGNQDNVEALASLGRAYLALGNLEMAKQNFRQITQLAGFDADWQERAAQLQIKARDYEGARYSLEKALLSKPGYFPALLLKATLEKQAGNLDVAEQQARSLASQRPRDASVQHLLGDIAMQRKKYSDAIVAYRNAYNYEKNAQHAVSLYSAYSRSGDTRMALEFVQSWARSNPADMTASRILAEAYDRAGQLEEAQRQYETLVKKLPDDANVQNELAYVMLKRGQPGALAVAEKAYGLAPRDANVADTYGWALVQAGQVDKGLRYLREAQVRAPSDTEIQGHLTEALRLKSRPQ